MTKKRTIQVINPDGQRSLEECQDLDPILVERRLDILKEEIRVLENRVKFRDTGHIKTTINTLTARVREIERRLDGDPGWFDEYLIGPL